MSFAAADLSFGWIPTWVRYVLAGLVFVGVVGAVLAVAWPRSVKHERMKQIAQFGPARTAVTAREPESPVSAVTRTALAASAAFVRSGDMEARMTLKLEQAGMRIKPHEWLLLRACAAATLGALFSLVMGLIGIVLGVLIAFLATWVIQTARIDRRTRTFNEQLPDALQLVIGSLRSGFSLTQGIDTLVREAPDPVAAEFGRALAEHRLGADISDSLDRVALRTRSDDLTWAVMAIRIQREVGGNLAEVLQTTVDTMRERGRLRRHVRALSAEGRFSAYVLIALPVVIAAAMFVFRPDYLRPLLTDPSGLAMLLVGVSLLALGIVWMIRIVKVDA